MNAKNFILSLRKIIREEVRTAVRQEVKQLLQEQRKPGIENQVKKVASATPRRTPPVLFDGPLSEILNETAHSMYSAPGEQEEWGDIQGKPFSADQAEGFGLTRLMSDQQVSADQPGISAFSGDPTAAFVKDYRGVMKAADKFSNKR